jgi:hypothetical protein
MTSSVGDDERSMTSLPRTGNRFAPIRPASSMAESPPAKGWLTQPNEVLTMTGPVVHQCPKCELRFSFRSELEYHLREDHPHHPAEENRPSSATRDDALAPASPSAAALGAPPPPMSSGAPASRPGRLASLLRRTRGRARL